MKGIMWAMLASTLWGISGTVMQFISQNQAIPADWFLSVRTLSAGIILLAIGFMQRGMGIFKIFKSWRSTGQLLAYATVGLMANMYTFYISIEAGSAAAATILQYLSPLFIVLGTLVFKREWPLRTDMIAFGVSLLGVFLAITRGNIHELAIPMNALIWGILSGVTAALYVVLPRRIVAENSPIIVLGWGTLIAGILFNLYHPLWRGAPTITPRLVISIGAVVLIGTIFAFSALLHSLQYAPSAVVSIVDAVQPVVTFVLSIIFLNLKVSIIEIIGSILVVFAIYILQHYRSKSTLE
ncbi:EamA family transporter [Lactobacillus sp. CBA3606]|uniref:DMT family transporter n=1 Tax=Lactobacillus sp. CBA3606 TaxID=2099789 RepID=UPI000CFB98C2|nr:DMT family transporter [Lactobacillus sp. CBA3606]AVK64808.1 EamA family transporter [Lactobacillus sp. CBA3606]